MAEVVLRRPYGSFETAGVAVLGVGGCISVLAIVTFIVVMLRSKQISVGVIPRTHVGLYILCYLIADLVTSFASVLNLNWVSLRRVEVGPVCSFQGIVKQLGDVGTAIWSLVIALHLFNLLFWRWEPRKYSCYATLIGGWALTFMIAFIGPTTMKKLEFGDFYGIAGHWCWITQPYAKARFSLEYIWMFLSSAFSFLLYFLVFLRLRGNLYVVDGRLHFRMVSNQNGWQLTLTQDVVDRQIMQVVRLLLWFPVLYIFVMLPMAITRFIEMEDNSNVPFAATFVANIPFSLSGLLTTILLYYVRKAIPDHEQLPSFVVPRPNVRKSIAETGVQPFKLSSPTPSTPDEKQMMAGTRRQMGGIDATPEVVAPPPAPVSLRSPSPNSLVNQMKKPRKPVPLQRLRANSTGSVLNSVTSGSPATATTASPQKLSPLRTGEIPIGISFNDLGHGRRHSESSPASYRPVHDAGAFRKKWQGGDLKLSYSNLRPHEWKAPQK